MLSRVRDTNSSATTAFPTESAHVALGFSWNSKLRISQVGRTVRGDPRTEGLGEGVVNVGASYFAIHIPWPPVPFLTSLIAGSLQLNLTSGTQSLTSSSFTTDSSQTSSSLRFSSNHDSYSSPFLLLST